MTVSPALRRAAPLVLLGAYFAAMAVVGWGRYGDLLIDTGRELEWPRRILAGEVLYRDLRFYYGPLPPYLNAALYAVFGVRLEVLAAAGLASMALAAWVIHRLVSDEAGDAAAFASTFLFLSACGFNHLLFRGIFNWVLPHSYGATYGTLAGLASLLFLSRHWRRRRSRDLAIAVALAVVASLCKVETFFPIAVTHVVLAVACLRERRWGRVQAAIYAAGLAAIVGIYGLFTLRDGRALWEDNLGGVVNAGSTFFVQMMMGLDAPGENLAEIAVGLLATAVAVAAALGCARLERSALDLRLRAAGCAGACAALAAAIVLSPPHAYWLFFAAAPIAGGAALALAARWLTGGERRADEVPVLLLAAFSVASIGRILLRSAPDRYGYFLLAGPIALLGVLAFRGIGARAGTADQRRSRAAAAVAMTVFLAVGFRVTVMSTRNLVAKAEPIRTPRGTVWVRPGVATNFVPILRKIEESPPGATLVVVPNATQLNFLSARRGVDGMPSHLPMEYFGGYTEERIVARWSRTPPDLIVYQSTGEMPEFGEQRWCGTYGLVVCRWVLEHYDPITDPGGRAVLLARQR